VHSNTAKGQACQFGFPDAWMRDDLHWNWTLVANGASCDATKDRCAGMWSAGKGPVLAKLVRFRAVNTTGAASV
jgi:hypothetical protein